MAQLAHEWRAQGARPVLLLHGFLGSGRNLRSLAARVAALAGGRGALTLDLTGHGASPPLPPDPDLAALAADVLETLRGLGLPRPLAVVGHSLGGRVALRAGLLDPGALERVVLLDIGPSPVPPGTGETGEVLRALGGAPAQGPDRAVFRAHLAGAGLPPLITEWLLQNLVPADGAYRWGIDRGALARLAARANAEDLWPAVEGGRAYAVACVRGGRSPYVGEDEARRLAAAGVPVDTVADAGHFLHVERPDAVAERVAAAL